MVNCFSSVHVWGANTLSDCIHVDVVFVQEFLEEMGRYKLALCIPRDKATVRGLIDYLDSTVKPGFKSLILDETGNVKYPVSIMVNGRRIEFLEGLDTRLKEGDRVCFSPRALFVV